MPLLPLWDFVACSRVNFNIYLYFYLWTGGWESPRDSMSKGENPCVE